MKAKVREFNGMVKTIFLGDGIPEESMYYIYITCITIDFVMGINEERTIHRF